MTMILQLPTQLAGATALKPLEPSWTLAPVQQTSTAEDILPGFLLRARDAVVSHPHNAIAYARLAQAAQANNRAQEAVDAARRGLDLGLDQQQPAVVYAAMLVLIAYAHHAELARLLDDRRCGFLPLSLRLRAAVAAGEHTAALSILSDPQSAGEISPDSSSVLTWVHLEREEFPQAIAAGRRAQASGTAGVALYSNLGYAHAALGQLAKAIKLTRQAAALAPQHRGVVFNLAGYHVLAGEPDEALRSLERLRAGKRIDIQLALAMASIMVEVCRVEDARGLLQRVRASREWALADTTPRAELEANLALLRVKTAETASHSAVAAIRRALATCDYESLPIAHMLTNLLIRSEYTELLADMIDRLQPRHPPAGLYRMRMQLALLRHEAGIAVDFAQAWARNELLNPVARAILTQLVADLDGDFERAGAIGLDGLRRAPHHITLINNTAYALAFAGNPARAKRVLERLPERADDLIEVVATRALVALLAGRVPEGLAGYRHARKLAIAADEQPLADLVAANMALACHTAGLDADGLKLDPALLDRLVTDAQDRPASWIVNQRLQRELEVHLPDAESSDPPRHLSTPQGITHTFPLPRPADGPPSHRRGLPPSSKG